MPNSLPPTPPRSPSPPRPLDIDSVFGSDDGDDDDLHVSRPDRPNDQHSNLPAVRRQFLAAGYREGLDAGRNDPRHAQRGFDEGYRVGAALGARVGLLRGIAASGQDGSEEERLARATDALTLEALVTDLQTRGLLDRELGAEQLVGDDVDDEVAKGATDPGKGEGEERGAQSDWRLPPGFVDDMAAVSHATGLAEVLYARRFGQVDARPLVGKAEPER